MPIDATGLQALSYFCTGNKANRTGYWLRWWDESMLLWGTERLQQEQ